MAEEATATRHGGTVAAAVAGVSGPVGVVLYETGNLDLFRAMPLINIWLVVLLGVVGGIAGVTALRRRMLLLGVVCLVANGAVLGLYGFLAAFFSLGGSR